jgi:hypothetical protein
MRTTVVSLLLLLAGCVRHDPSVVQYHTALYRIERGVYDEVELRPQWMWLRTDGVEQRSFWPGGQMRPEQKSDVNLQILQARASGHEIRYISGGEADAQSPPAPEAGGTP